MPEPSVPITEKFTVTVKEAAALSGLPESFLYGMVRAGELPVIRTGAQGGIHILRVALKAWVDAQAVPETPTR